MTDNEIIKALEEMVDYPHNYEEGQELKNVLDLINRQKAEIERLKQDRYLAKENGEIELMPRTNIEKIKTEAIKDLLGKLEPLKKFRSCMADSEYELTVTMREIDAVAKELVGGTDA
jgi:hypothetical protein